MGKQRHSSDKMYLLQSEWKQFYGGYKGDKRLKLPYRTLPFYCCALSLQHFKDPVGNRKGHVFEITNIVPWLKEKKTNPVDGTPLSMKDLKPFKFHKNKEDKFFCPVTYKEFTDSSKIVAIFTSGNVYSFEAVQQLNIKTKSMKDLLTGESFTKEDIIVLQDPTETESREIATFKHVRVDEGKESKESMRLDSESKNIMAKARAAAAAATKGETWVSAKDEYYENAMKSVQGTSRGEVSASFTSTSSTIATIHQKAEAREEETFDSMLYRVRKAKKKGYVQLGTSLGPLNIELRCDVVPKTCYNFIKLAKKGYYTNTQFHRIIKGFMAQGGDPTATGTGGESIWGKKFADEFDDSLRHSARGVLSMANSGPDTNGSQFFITFGACPHLDNKHTVFGSVVGGKQNLVAFEQAGTDAKDKPLTAIVIQKVAVFVDPFEEDAEAQKKKEAETSEEVVSKRKAEQARAEERGNWFSGGTSKSDASGQDSLAGASKVGKYMPTATAGKSDNAAKSAEEAAAAGPAQKRQKFGSFSGW